MAPVIKTRAKAKSSGPTSKASNLKKPSAPSKTPSTSSKSYKQKATASKQTQVKTKRLSAKDALNKKKKRVYTAEQLGVPQLNGIVPIGVQKPKGKKKGKVFVDDPDSMMTILKIVEADKQGQIESKILRERQLEEVREARRKEQESRFEEKKARLEETKDSLRKRRKRKADEAEFENAKAEAEIKRAVAEKTGKSRKRVSFG